MASDPGRAWVCVGRGHQNRRENPTSLPRASGDTSATGIRCHTQLVKSCTATACSAAYSFATQSHHDAGRGLGTPSLQAAPARRCSAAFLQCLRPRCPCPTLQAYSKVCTKLKELSALQGISGLLGWDEVRVREAHSAQCTGLRPDRACRDFIATRHPARPFARLADHGGSPALGFGLLLPLRMCTAPAHRPPGLTAPCSHGQGSACALRHV